MTVAELFDRCGELAAIEPSRRALRYLHETLVLACAEALHGSRQAFGNVFSQVDYLCKHHGVAMRERIAIQQMRRHSNGKEESGKRKEESGESQEQLSHEDWLYDVRAIALFISSVFHTDIPHELLSRLPAKGRQPEEYARINQSYIRCIVDSWDDSHIYATTAEGPICVEDTTLQDILATGMQLNLLDCHREGTTIKAGLLVVEPDFLIDISAIAACFQDYGHHPMSYLFNRLKERVNTQAILLGNFAGTALDDLIHHPDTPFADTLRKSFCEQSLQFCTCAGFDGARFKTDALQQEANIREAVDVLFHDSGRNGLRVGDTYDIQRALLEPSFVCEHLGLQGRVDLMTDDMKLLVEQKSGKNWNIERLMQQLPPVGPYPYQEAHYVQLLLYFGVLRYNFHLSSDRVDIRLLYSKYPASQGLLVVNFYQQLFREAIQIRNRIVAQEIRMAREGFTTIMPQLRPSILLERTEKADFFNQYIRGPLEQLTTPLHRLSDVERRYVERLFTFVYREQLAQKTGVQEGQGGSQADLWNMPLSVKQETGSILMGPLVAHDTEHVTLQIDTTQVLPNFRRGDMVYLYRCDEDPDVCSSILYKGVIAMLADTQLTIRLNERQQNEGIFSKGTYAVEHASSDTATTSALRSIHAFCCASADKRQLLLGQRAPRRDTSLSLSRSYHVHYDEMLLKAKQAKDYFLLQGPPGTGKTSMALRFLVEEELSILKSQISNLNSQTSILLNAYTHRAVDEICSMLEEAGISYLRLGSEDSCDPRFVHRLLKHIVGKRPKMGDIQRRLQAMNVVVSTTSTLLSQPFLIQLMNFSLCIVDEASQILEPNIIGLLVSDHIQRFILIGDHKQLPAVVQQPDDEPSLHACRLSLFERLLQQERAAGRDDFVAILRRQGRMHPDIAAFPNEFFYATEHLQPVPLPHQEETALRYEQPSQDDLDDLLKQHRVLFFDSGQYRQSGISSEYALSDKVNIEEARMVADLLRRIVRQYGARFDAQKTVGVIVPYRNQIAMIRRELAQLGLPQLNAISIDTVERYQGSQRDVIIYSFTIRHPYQLDFLTANCFEESGSIIDRKLNVAMTRARKQLLMTGCTRVLSQNPLFAELIRRYSLADNGTHVLSI